MRQINVEDRDQMAVDLSRAQGCVPCGATQFKLNSPHSLLPDGCLGRDMRSISIGRNLVATAQTKKRVSSLIDKLKEDPGED
jgi:hypothetical protein